MTAWLREQMFNWVHSNNLIYNQCWEDPRLDHEALQISKKDRVLVLTSAGCNVLDYLLKEPLRIDAVDLNPRQNSLLELKLAGLRNLDFEDFFALFGKGKHPQAEKIYYSALRSDLPEFAQHYWDRSIRYFNGQGWRSSFYFWGTSGLVARVLQTYCQLRKLDEPISQAFSSRTIEEQQKIYYSILAPAFWRDWIRWFTRRGSTMSCLGVPRSQFLQIEENYAGGMAKFIEDCIEAVFARLPLKDNYFWRLYLFGSYSESCCPEYLKPENFQKLKHLTDRVHTHNKSVLEYLESGDDPITKVSLLDHMDWLYLNRGDVLKAQWQALLNRSTSATRIIWRSACLKVDFVDPIPVRIDGQSSTVGDRLIYDVPLANRLHALDRVHTYASLSIASLSPT